LKSDRKVLQKILTIIRTAGFWDFLKIGTSTKFEPMNSEKVDKTGTY